jgi:soluble lytic murein transglycosylase-like protein
MHGKTTALLVIAAFAAACATTSTTTNAGRSPAQARRPAPKVETPNPKASDRCRDLLPLIRTAASEANMDPALLVGLVRTESNFRPDARSPVGAMGLTQVMPLTGRAKKCGDLSNPMENLRCGLRVLGAFMKWYKGDIYLSLSGYNAGHGMPDKAARTHGLPANADYVEAVLWGRARFLNRGCDF